MMDDKNKTEKAKALASLLIGHVIRQVRTADRNFFDFNKDHTGTFLSQQGTA